ncbi:MAG: tRNA lysidine(34) synthetase TilS [Pseudomonadota bacterium]
MVDHTSQTIDEEFRAALRRLIPGQCNVLGVAVSGGGDSMALLDLAASSGFCDHIVAATVDHGLRAEARGEAQLVASHCVTLGISHDLLSLPSLPEAGNLSARLRDARYGVLASWAKGKSACAVLLGHTMDDQAETVLMRLARGSGAEGLSGMAPVREVDDVQFLRPLLSLRRQDLRSWLTAHGIAWAEDPTNEDQSFDRVKARHALEVLTPLGIDVPGLAATADRLRRQGEVLTTAAKELADQACRENGGTVVINREALRRAVSDTAMRVLADVLRRTGGHVYRPRFRALLPLYEKTVGIEVTRTTLGRCLIDLTPSEILIRREPCTALDDGAPES